MEATRRPFCGEADKQAMLALARAFRSDNIHVVDLPYRLSSWALDDPENAGLWATAGGQLLAWAVMQTPFWFVDCVFHGDADEGLQRQVLNWADRRARSALGTPSGRPAWFVNVFADQNDRMRGLEAAGFASQADVGENAWSKVFMLRPPGTPIADCELPAGFKVRPLAGMDEVPAYVDLQRAVFESKNMTLEWRARTLQRPEYRPELDLVVEAPDGRLAAFYVGWLDDSDPAGPLGQIEPLGVREEFRRLGLGQAILSEGLRRFSACGATRVYVETDAFRGPALQTYESAGFRVVRNILVYRKDYGR